MTPSDNGGPTPHKKARLTIAEVVQEGVQKHEEIAGNLLNLVQATIRRLEGKQAMTPRAPSQVKKEFVLKHTFEKVSALVDGAETEFNENEEHFGVQWSIGIRRCAGYLAADVYCEREVDATEWSVETEEELSVDLSKKMKLTESSKNIYTKKNNICGNDKFVDWDWISKHAKDDKLTVQVRVKIIKMTLGKEKLRDFDNPVTNLTDVVLNVRGVKFYVSSQILAHQSDAFKSMFFNTTVLKEQREFELHEDDPGAFQNFLELIYGEEELDDKTIEGLLVLADKYAASKVLEKCEKFLINKSEKELKKKYEMAIRFKLVKLTEYCISKMETREEFGELVKSNMENMDLAVAKAMLKKCLELH